MPGHLGPRLVHRAQVVATMLVPRTALARQRRSPTVAKLNEATPGGNGDGAARRGGVGERDGAARRGNAARRGGPGGGGGGGGTGAVRCIVVLDAREGAAELVLGSGRDEVAPTVAQQQLRHPLLAGH